MLRPSKQPPVLFSLPLGRNGEFIEPVSDYHTAIFRCEPAALATKVEYRLAGRPRPAPTTLNQCYDTFVRRTQNGRLLGDPDVTRLEVGNAFREPQIVAHRPSELGNRVGARLQSV